MKIQLWSFLAVLALSSVAEASTTPAEFPCHGLPADAVKSVPAPFDTYMEIVCTRLGQSLVPRKGFAFIGPDHLSHGFLAFALDDDPDANSVYFTSLRVRVLNGNDIAKLRTDLHKVTDIPALFQARIIWMDEATSSGKKKQLILLIPQNVSDIPVQGMECNADCIPITEDPWFFSVEGREAN
jgi:hypothetical protein